MSKATLSTGHSTKQARQMSILITDIVFTNLLESEDENEENIKIKQLNLTECIEQTGGRWSYNGDVNLLAFYILLILSASVFHRNMLILGLDPTLSGLVLIV
jgi:hypothetical protein